VRGDALGRYVVIDKIGAGGMGVVYRAYDPQLDRRVALKLLRTGLQTSEEDKIRLTREAKALARLDHPNVVGVHDVGEHQGHVFVAMEYVSGHTLTEQLFRMEDDPVEVLRLFVEAGRGLAAAHAAGLVHRDFKPENVMVGDDGRVRVMDFGLVRSQGASEAPALPPAAIEESAPVEGPLTELGAVMGTPAYMAPEQHLGLRVDARADQFSFCISLYEALHGRRPFAGRSIGAVLMAITNGEVRDPAPGSNVPRWLDSALIRGLANEPEQRWASMEALLAELARDRTPGRGRWVLGGGLTVALGLGAVAGWSELDERATREACVDAAASIETIWNDERALTIGAALTGSGVSNADETWSRARERISTWTASWSAARESTCIAADVDEALSAEQADLRDACLDDHRAHIQSMLERFADADKAMVQRVASAVARLPRVSDCSDARLLAIRPALPDDEETRTRRADLRATLARSAAAGDAGQYEDGMVSAEEAYAGAENLGWASGQASAALQISLLERRLGRFAESREHAEEAYYSAGRVGDDLLALRAANQVIVLAAKAMRSPEDGMEWTRQGAMLVDRLGVEDTLLDADLAVSIGILRRARGETDQAVDQLRRAVTIRSRELGESHSSLSTTLTTLGNALVQQRKPEEAIALHLRALQIDEAVLGPNHPRLGNTLNNLGIAYVFSRRFADAEATHRRALAVRTATLGAKHRDTIGSLSGLGGAFLNAGRYEEARESFADALQRFEAVAGPESHEVSNSAGNLARANYMLERYDRALELSERARVIDTKLKGEKHRDVIQHWHNIARIQRARGAWDEAIEACERSLVEPSPLAPTARGEAHFTLARAAWERAETGDRDRAHEHASRARGLFVEGRVPADQLAAVDAWIAERW
jgi:tetratricopeptide (TPR) repeat protein